MTQINLWVTLILLIWLVLCAGVVQGALAMGRNGNLILLCIAAAVFLFRHRRRAPSSAASAKWWGGTAAHITAWSGVAAILFTGIGLLYDSRLNISLQHWTGSRGVTLAVLSYVVTEALGAIHEQCRQRRPV